MQSEFGDKFFNFFAKYFIQIGMVKNIGLRPAAGECQRLETSDTRKRTKYTLAIFRISSLGHTTAGSVRFVRPYQTAFEIVANIKFDAA